MTKSILKMAIVIASLSAVAYADMPLPKCLPCSPTGKVVAKAVLHSSAQR